MMMMMMKPTLLASFFFNIIFIIIWISTSHAPFVNSQQTDSCSSTPSINGISFDITNFQCFSVWESQGFILRVSKKKKKNTLYMYIFVSLFLFSFGVCVSIDRQKIEYGASCCRRRRGMVMLE